MSDSPANPTADAAVPPRTVSDQMLWRIASGALVVLALVFGLAVGGEKTQEAAVAQMAYQGLEELAPLAGLRDESNNRIGDPLDVVVVQDSGPGFTGDAVRAAVNNHPDFSEGDSRHLLRIEVVRDSAHHALALHLWRQGWELRTPDPVRLIIAPWIALVSAVVGLGVAFWRRNLSLGALAAGLSAQLTLALFPWPKTFTPRYGLAERVARGPLVTRVQSLVAIPDELVLPGAAAVIVFCLVLVAFDHKRSKDKESSIDLGTASLTAVFGAAGVLLWLEAAGRSGFFASLATVTGVLAALALAGAYLPVVRDAIARWRASRA